MRIGGVAGACELESRDRARPAYGSEVACSIEPRKLVCQRAMRAVQRSCVGVFADGGAPSEAVRQDGRGDAK